MQALALDARTGPATNAIAFHHEPVRQLATGDFIHAKLHELLQPTCHAGLFRLSQFGDRSLFRCDGNDGADLSNTY